MKRIFFLIPIVLTIGLFICGTLFAAPVKLRISLGVPEQHFLGEAIRGWAGMIEKNSNGEIKPELYYSAQLFRDNEVLKAVQTGAVDCGLIYTMYLQTQLVPAIKILQFPFLFNTLEETWKVMNSDVGKAWKETAEKKGVKLIATVLYPTPEGNCLMTTKPVKVPADMKNLVIRSISPENAAMIKKWGAGPSFITAAELYMAIQRGALQGAMVALPAYVERKFYEVAPNLIMLPYASIHTYIALNKSYFDRLTPAQRKVVMDASEVINKTTYDLAMKVLKRDFDEAKKSAKVYVPTAAELAQWKQGAEAIWAEDTKNDKVLTDMLVKVREILKR